MKKVLALILMLALSAGVCFAEGLNISKAEEFVNYKIGTQRSVIRHQNSSRPTRRQPM